MDPAARMEDKLTVLLPDFDTDDLNTLLPWLYGDGSDEQQPDPELIKAMSIGQPQTFTKLPEGVESVEQLKQQAQINAAAQFQQANNMAAPMKPELDPRLAPMDTNSLFAVKEWNQEESSEADDDIQ